MELSRGTALALAQQACTFCMGLGVCNGRHGKVRACNCVLRSIFRACYARFRQSAEREKFISRAAIERVSYVKSKNSSSTYGMKNEEYMADFILIARRVLDDAEYRLFSFHFLLGADWRICSKKLGLDRGEFFHQVYRVQQKLGAAFYSIEPYALFPVDEYFSSPSGEARRRLDPDAAVEALSVMREKINKAQAAEERESQAARFPFRPPQQKAA